MQSIEIGDYIVPIYIEDEWLAQYTNLPCKVVGRIHKQNLEYNSEFWYIQCQYKNYDVFTLISPPDKFELYKKGR